MRKSIITAIASLLITTAATAAEVKPVVNINTATVAELQLLPGVGPKLASAIHDFAETGDPSCDHKCQFKTPEDLLKVKGIGPAKLAKIRPYVVVQGPTTAKKKLPSAPTVAK
jgi:competence protein ComEA